MTFGSDVRRLASTSSNSQGTHWFTAKRQFTEANEEGRTGHAIGNGEGYPRETAMGGHETAREVRGEYLVPPKRARAEMFRE